MPAIADRKKTARNHTRKVSHHSVAPFCQLRLSEEQYATYQRYMLANPSFDYKLNPAHPLYEGRIIRVYGYGQEAVSMIERCETAVFIQNKGSNDDVEATAFLEMRWDSMECIYHVIGCIEEKLRILSPAWALAGNGLVLTDPQTRLIKHPLFKERTLVELHLVPYPMLKNYLSQTTTVHTYKYLTPRLPSNIPMLSSSDPQPVHELYWYNVAVTSYYMNAPIMSPRWASYVAARRAYDAELQLRLNSYRGKPLCPLLEQIRDAVTGVLSDGSNRAVHTRTLEIMDGTIPFEATCVMNEYGLPTSAGVYTRIFSLVRPVIIDVNLTYHDTAWWKGDETWPWCSLRYRIQDLEASDTSVLQDILYPQDDTADAWETIFACQSNSLPEKRIYANIQSNDNQAANTVWNMSRSHVERVHRALFGRHDNILHDTGNDDMRPGPTGGDDLYGLISRIDTVRLLFAAAGIFLHVQRFLGDSMDTQDADDISNFRWRFSKAFVCLLADRIRASAMDF